MTVLATRFAVLTVILATPALASSSADRSFDPSDYTPGQAVTVTITLSVDAGVMAMALEDAPPSGWTVSNISNGGVWDSTNELVRWGMFFQGGMPTTLTYEATPPGGESGTKTFAGTMYLDGSSQAVTGESSIDSDNSLTDGLVAYYPFDGDPNDYSGSGNHGTAHGDVSYLSGVHGQGATFDGNSDFVTLAQPLGLYAADYTIAFWLRSTDTNAYVIHSWASTGDGNPQEAFIAHSGGSGLSAIQCGDMAAVAGGVLNGQWRQLNL